MRRLLIDTNVLLLWMIGSHDRRLVGTHRRVVHFDGGNFDLLGREIARFDQLVTTGAVLCELSSLLGNDFHRSVARTFSAVAGPMAEASSPKELVVEHRSFSQLGFADVSVLLALDAQTSLLTDDARLYGLALSDGFEARNFNHLRTFLEGR